MMQEKTPYTFGKIRSFFWPVYTHELKKLIPMFLLFFLISFVYNILRCMKIPLVVQTGGAGSAVVPYLKIGFVLPAAVLLTYIFTKLAMRFTREQVFYTMLIGFLLYFALFAFVLFPKRNDLELTLIANFLQKHVFTGKGFHELIAVIRHWNLALFYVLSEMWSTVVLSMLFWGFANEVTQVHEAKRFYAIFALGANMSGIFTGLFNSWLGKLKFVPLVSGYTVNEQWILYQLIAVLCVGIIIISIFHWLTKTVFHIDENATIQIPKKVNHFSLKESFTYLRESKYLIYIVIIVVGYNLVYNLADVMWTEQAHKVYTEEKDFNAYLSQITLVTGIIAALFAFIVSGNVIRRYGWTIAALVTPTIWLITSSGLFISMTANQDLLASFLGTAANPANFILLIASVQICLGRGCKYTVFDETKEMAFMPLSKTNQRKAKAIVDGLASRFGKSGGALLYLILFHCVGNESLSRIVPHIGILMITAILLWIFAVRGLGKMVVRSIDQEDSTFVPELKDTGTVASKEETTTGDAYVPPVILQSSPSS